MSDFCSFTVAAPESGTWRLQRRAAEGGGSNGRSVLHTQHSLPRNLGKSKFGDLGIQGSFIQKNGIGVGLADENNEPLVLRWKSLHATGDCHQLKFGYGKVEEGIDYPT